jgi:hypothetical protein
MFDANRKRLLLAAAMVATAGLAAACESDVQREMRLEREALKKSGDLEELQKQLDTVNPDLYAPDETKTKNIGRFKNN